MAGRRYRWLRRAGLLTAGACAGFFRHPPRVPPHRPGVVVAPADGLICVIDTAAPPAELGTGRRRAATGQHLPVAVGRPRAARPGERRSDRRTAPAGSLRLGRLGRGQRRQRTRQHADPHRRRDGRSSRCRSPACWRGASSATYTPGDKLSIGDTYGLIRFGSRLDTYLPAGAEVLVSVGQRAVGGETVLAELP